MTIPGWILTVNSASNATLVFGFPNRDELPRLRVAIDTAIQSRCQTEGNRQPSTADLLTGLIAGLSTMQE